MPQKLHCQRTIFAMENQSRFDREPRSWSACEGARACVPQSQRVKKPGLKCLTTMREPMWQGQRVFEPES
jgi:hypothetical protein